MKVQLISAASSGGAGRAVRRLQAALNTANIDTTLRVQRNASHPDEHLAGYPIPWWVSPAVSRTITSLTRGQSIRSMNLFPTGRLAALNESSADILNLHWIGSDTLSVREIGRISKPWVWTMHDMWAFCGTEHVASDNFDARWRLGYPSMPGLHFDLDQFVWREKKKHFPTRGYAVCPSAWLAQCVRDSALLSNWTVKTIPNALDTNLFQPTEQQKARQQLNLPLEDFIIVFGAHGADVDHNKGLDLFHAMINRLGSLRTGLHVHCLVFGNAVPGPTQLNGIPVTYLGRLDRDDEIVRAYGASNVVVVPSRIENLPQVATEAQSCARAVLAFATTGLNDAVLSGKTGCLIPPFDTDAAAHRLSEFTFEPSILRTFGENARRRALEQWEPTIVADAYQQYYSEILGHRSQSALM